MSLSNEGRAPRKPLEPSRSASVGRTGGRAAGRSVGRAVNRSGGRPVGRAIGWAGRSGGRPRGQAVNRLGGAGGRSVGRSAGWSGGRPVGRAIGWSVGRFGGRSGGSSGRSGGPAVGEVSMPQLLQLFRHGPQVHLPDAPPEAGKQGLPHALVQPMLTGPHLVVLSYCCRYGPGRLTRLLRTRARTDGLRA